MTLHDPEEGFLKHVRYGRVLAPVLAICLPCLAQATDVMVPAEGRSLALTVYNQDLALIRDRRSVVLPAGEVRLVFADVSPKMLAETADVRGGGIRVGAQVLDFDLLTPANLLRRAVGTEVTLMRPATPAAGETPVRARLLSDDGPVLEIGGHIEVAPPGRIVYDRLPEGLSTAPTLSSLLTVAAAGKHDLDLTYLATGLGWHAEYQVQMEGGEDKADLQAWVMLTNASGASFRDAKLTLATGDIHRAGAASDVAGGRPRMLTMAPAAPAAIAANVVPEDMAGVSLYSLPDAVSLDDRQSKQLLLFTAAGVPAHRELTIDSPPIFVGQPFDPARNRDPVFSRPQSVLVLDNTAASAVALPPGVVRVFKRDRDGGSQLLGEDRVGQKAKGEAWRIVLGRDGDVGVARTQTSFVPPPRPDGNFESAWRITLSNAKAQPVTVLLREYIPAGGAILEESQPHQQSDARSTVWPIKVPAQGEAVFTYKVGKTGG